MNTFGFDFQFEKTMKQLITFSMIILTVGLTSCTDRRGQAKPMTHEDTLRVKSDQALRVRLLQLQKMHENLIAPVADGDPTVCEGEKYKTNLLGDSINAITGRFEALESKLERAQKDSSTIYGALLTRFRLLSTQHKYLTATYTSEAHLLRFTSEITFDDKHEEDRDYYFSNDTLVYLRVKRTYTQDDQDVMTDDSYFIRNGKVGYAYRDMGNAPSRRNRMNVIPLERYHMKGNVTAHVSKEFEGFRQDYDILLNRPFEPLMYP
jgi:hypothetical protein